MKLKTILSLLILFISCSAIAAGRWTHGNVKIKNIIWIPGHHGFYVEPSTFDNPDNCIPESGSDNLYRFSAETEADTKTTDRLFILITTAIVSQSNVTVFVDGCIGGTPRVTGIQLNK